SPIAANRRHEQFFEVPGLKEPVSGNRSRWNKKPSWGPTRIHEPHTLALRKPDLRTIEKAVHSEINLGPIEGGLDRHQEFAQIGR
ncbi:MAG: hypothetical protein ACI957_004100, partial [Verrucomicrobiales bacterium]